jgi:hypothetical protein
MSLLRFFKLIGDTSGNIAEVTENKALKVSVDNSAPFFNFDAGGRTRMSQITTLLDGKVLGQDDVELFENVGTGTSLYGNNKVNMVAAVAGQYAIRQSTRFTPYFSGKSQLIECTFDNFQTEANVVKRIGYFSSNAVAPYDTNYDGFYIENDNGTFKLKAERAGTTTIDVDFTLMDNYTAIADYNWENFTVIAFDFLWLGGAVLRFFVKTQKGFELIHTVNYSGTSKDVFILSPNQPIRYEIRSSTGTGSLRYVCSQVATEGSTNESGKTLSIYNPSVLSANSIGTIYALKSVKKQEVFRDTPVQIIDVQIARSASTDSGILMLLLNPTLSAPIVYTNNGKLQEGTATNQTITPGTGRLIASTPIGSEGGGTQVMRENFLAFLSNNIDNTMNEYVLAYMPITNNQSVSGILTVKEF